jgi:hypothetical protein
MASPSEGVTADCNDVAMAASLLGGESAGSEATGSAAISEPRNGPAAGSLGGVAGNL